MNEKEKAAAEQVCQLIDDFNAKRNAEKLLLLFIALMEVQVSVPMTVSMEDRDMEKFLHAKAGDKITTAGAIRMKPDMLKNDAGELFFPAFTLKEESPENYRNHFSWITMDFMNCVNSAYHNENCSGVVINGFSNPFVMNRPLLELMIQMRETK